MISNEIILAFLKCPYKAYQKFHNHSGSRTEYERVYDDVAEHSRTTFIQQLCTTIPSEQVLQRGPLPKKRQIPTLTYVLSPSIQSKQYHIRFDLVEISPRSRRDTTAQYIPYDIVPYGRVTKCDKLFLAIRSLIAAQLLSVSIEQGRLLYGQALKPNKIRLHDYTKDAQKILRQLQNVLHAEHAPSFLRQPHCQICEFCQSCETALRDADDLSLLAGMKPADVRKRNNRGFFTTLQLSYTYRPRKRKKAAPAEPRFDCALKALAIREKCTYIQEPPKLPDSTVEIYLDFEGIPDEQYIYLIGVLLKSDNQPHQYSFWADSVEQEIVIFEQLFTLCSSLENFVVYHYGSYETRSLQAFNRKWENRYHDQIAHITDHAVNILSFFTTVVYPPTYTNGLKDVAQFIGFTWSAPEASGLQSIAWRKRWELVKEPHDKQCLETYNLEDCQALALVTQWLRRLGDHPDSCQGEITPVSEIPRDSIHPYGWGQFKARIPEFKDIERYAYFDYQREKVYFKTEKHIQKSLKRTAKRDHIKNVANTVLILPPPACCPFCGHPHLYRYGKCHKIQIDLKLMKHGVKKWVTLIKGRRFQCRSCEAVFIQERFKQFSHCGRSLITWCVHHHITYNLRMSTIRAILLESFHLTVSEGRLGEYEQSLAKQYALTFQEIQQHVLSGRILHADETQIHVRGYASGYVWIFASFDAVFYLFRPNREADFLTELLQSFQGILISDFYPGYDSLPCRQQKCLIHLIRDLNDDLFKHQIDTEFRTFVVAFGTLLKSIMATVQTYGLKRRHLHKHQKEVDKFYRVHVECDVESELTSKYQKRFLKNKEKLFTFLNDDGIPWNNNNAEHAIKPFAKCRREMNGLFTKRTIGGYLTLLSIQQTCKYRGLSFLEFLKSEEMSMEAYSRKH